MKRLKHIWKYLTSYNYRLRTQLQNDLNRLKKSFGDFETFKLGDVNVIISWHQTSQATIPAKAVYGAHIWIRDNVVEKNIVWHDSKLYKVGNKLTPESIELIKNQTVCGNMLN